MLNLSYKSYKRYMVNEQITLFCLIFLFLLYKKVYNSTDFKHKKACITKVLCSFKSLKDNIHYYYYQHQLENNLKILLFQL